MDTSTTTSSPVDTITALGGYGVVHIGLGVIASSIAMVVSCALIGTWMSVLLMLIAFVIKLLSAFAVPFVEQMIPEATYAAIGNKAIGATTWVVGLFSSKAVAA